MTRFVPFGALIACALLLASCDAGGSMTGEHEPAPDEGAASIQLTAEADGETVALEWSGSNLDDATSYRLYRGTEADFDTTGAFYLALSEMEYIDEDVTPGQPYHYRVAAIGEAPDDVLALSASDHARPQDQTPPPAPQQPTGAGGFYEASLSWEAVSSDDLDGYHVYRSQQSFTEATPSNRITTTILDTTGFVDTAVLDEKRYFYRITAMDTHGNESAPSTEISVTPTVDGNHVRGRELFADVCAACHTSTDAWDIIVFAMPDTMVHRRALNHVTEQQAIDIIEFIHSSVLSPLPGAHLGETKVPLFQPGGQILASDQDFAHELFGADHWPADLHPEDLTAIDPTALPIPLRMPRWSVEENATDWLPERPLPDRIRLNSAVQEALHTYRSLRTNANLVRLVRALRAAGRGAPDRFPTPSQGVHGPEAVTEVFELNRWISTLTGTHALRRGNSPKIMKRLFAMTVDGAPTYDMHQSLVSEWWAVGDILRLTRDAEDINLLPAYGTGHWKYVSAAQWFYLSWQFRPEGQTDFAFKHFVRMLGEAGYPRLASFVAAYVAADGRAGHPETLLAFRDLGPIAPAHWLPDVSLFILETYLDRLEAGETFGAPGEAWLIDAFKTSVDRILNRNDGTLLTSSEAEDIRALRDAILSHIRAQAEQ